MFGYEELARQILDRYENDDDTTDYGQLRKLARTIAERHRDGDAAMGPNLVEAMPAASIIVLCLEFTKIIGVTSEDERLAMLGQVAQYAFPERFSSADSAPLSDEERSDAGHVVYSGVGWLQYHATSPVKAITYALEELAGWSALTTVTVGLSWIAADRLAPAAEPDHAQGP